MALFLPIEALCCCQVKKVRRRISSADFLSGILVLAVLLILLILLIILLVLLLILILIIHACFLRIYFCVSAVVACPRFYDLFFALKIKLTNSPATIAAVIPPAQAFSPPVKIPINPF